ncbi:uncharacterized protein EDB93DRAFT_863038 [Suillus bovinus]|uniref:uncharacterized protein n=1 Tax=Suillus bovinus TaxID=48563 RepID=UPI001B869C45|nr:uncharacterized protein EDB93DRAFT_863038 [Suillus bovinus]KAG2156711.1 hypothetical protein EDB93DRAFT_863038 [Suillus bovinus]
MSNQWMYYYPNNFRLAPSPPPSRAPISSTPVSSASAAPIFQQTTIASDISLQHLYADVKSILQSVEASLEEQKKISKDLNDLSTTVNVLEGVLCGNVSPGRGKRKKKKGDNMNLDTLQSEGSIVRRLATMDATINHLLAHVARLDTASRHPEVSCDASATTCTPSSSLQEKANNFYRATASAHSEKYIHNVQCDSSSSGSTDSRPSPDSTMSPSVFNHVSSPTIVNVSSRSAASATLHARVPANGPDLSSPLPTPSPETPVEESFSTANNSNFRSWTPPNKNTYSTSLRTFPNSLLNPIPPSSTNPIHKPTRTSIQSASRSLDSGLDSAPANFTPTLTLPFTSSTSGSSTSPPVSGIAPIAPTPFSSSPSSSTRTADMHLASPPQTPTSMLARAHTTASYHILPQVYQDIGGDVDCEGPCMECKMRRYEHQERFSQSMNFLEQNTNEETRDQSTVAGSSRICLNTSSVGPSLSFGEASLPALEAQPEVPGVPLATIETHGIVADSWHGLGANRTDEDGESHGSGRMWTNEYGEVNGDFSGPSLEESSRLGHMPDTGGSGKAGLDSLNEPGHDDSGECEREQSLQTEHKAGGLDGALEESFNQQMRQTLAHKSTVQNNLSLQTQKTACRLNLLFLSYVNQLPRIQCASMLITWTSMKISVLKTPANKHLQILSFEMNRLSSQCLQPHLLQQRVDHRLCRPPQRVCLLVHLYSQSRRHHVWEPKRKETTLRHRNQRRFLMMWTTFSLRSSISRTPTPMEPRLL